MRLKIINRSPSTGNRQPLTDNRIPYRLVDHTADLGLEVCGQDPAALFLNAAFAMFDQIWEGPKLKPQKRMPLSVEGADRPDLMINWLRELLFLFNGQNLLLDTLKIETITPTALTAGLTLFPFDAKQHRLKTEIKAVTYHQVEVVRIKNGWRTRIIFDL